MQAERFNAGAVPLSSRRKFSAPAEFFRVTDLRFSGGR